MDDRGWQARMLAMQGLVAGKGRSLPVMLEALRDGSVPQRILSAQSLGFLAPRVPREALLDAIRPTSWPPLRAASRTAT